MCPLCGSGESLDDAHPTLDRKSLVMSQPPIPLEEIRQSILTAIRDFNWEKARPILAELVGNTPSYMAEHWELEHTIPGASSVTKCRRAQWFPTHLPDDEGQPREEWIYAAAVGMLVEPWWAMMLTLADPRLVVTPTREPREIVPGVLGTPDGELKNIDALVEWKASGSWDYIYTREDGIRKNHMDHIAQANLNLDAVNKDWCLIVHNTVAPGLVRWLKAPLISVPGQKRKKKDPNFRYPFFDLNWIERDPHYVAYLKERLVILQEDQASEEIAPREHNPWDDEHPHPCQTLCRWRDSCMEAG